MRLKDNRNYLPKTQDTSLAWSSGLSPHQNILFSCGGGDGEKNAIKWHKKRTQCLQSRRIDKEYDRSIWYTLIEDTWWCRRPAVCISLWRGKAGQGKQHEEPYMWREGWHEQDVDVAVGSDQVLAILGLIFLIGGVRFRYLGQGSMRRATKKFLFYDDSDCSAMGAHRPEGFSPPPGSLGKSTKVPSTSTDMVHCVLCLLLWLYIPGTIL